MLKCTQNNSKMASREMNKHASHAISIALSLRKIILKKNYPQLFNLNKLFEDNKLKDFLG